MLVSVAVLLDLMHDHFEGRDSMVFMGSESAKCADRVIFDTLLLLAQVVSHFLFVFGVHTGQHHSWDH